MSEKKEYKSRVIPSDKVQLNFNANAENAIKLKQIALNEQVSSADILNMALGRFITAYEAKHGKVKTAVKTKGEGLKNL